MAGTLTLSTLSDGTNSTSVTNAIQGSAKAWVNFYGISAGTIRASYNISSITRNGSGDYTVNFTNAFVDNNYVMTGSYEGASDPGALFIYASAGTSTAPTLITATQCRIKTTLATDAYWISAVFHR